MPPQNPRSQNPTKPLNKTKSYTKVTQQPPTVHKKPHKQTSTEPAGNHAVRVGVGGLYTPVGLVVGAMVAVATFPSIGQVANMGVSDC